MMKTVKDFSVLVELDLSVSYGAKSEMEALHSDSIRHLNVLVANHNGNVIELKKVMDWEFTDDQQHCDELEMIFGGLKIEALTEVEEENAKKASAVAQYMLHDLTIQDIVVTATLNDGTVTPLKVKDWFLDVTSIQEM